jgi:benzoate membrane transport protein
MPAPSDTPQRAASPRQRSFLADIGPTYFANGFIGWLFAATGPVAIILSVATAAKLNEAEIGSWLFGVFFVNGIVTIWFCLRYRQPLAFFWTIPGTVLVGTALTHLRFAEVIGAYYATGLVMLLLGATGWVRRAMQWVPMPIVMAMVAGVFLRFGLDLVRALGLDPAVAAPMVVVWLALSAMPALARRVPPLIGALVVGIGAIVALGRLDVAALGVFRLAQPVLQIPEWSWPAMVELVVPLAITVLVVQNGQGFAVLKAARHEPPVDAITVACGVGAILSAIVGSISTCLTGPTNAILTSSGERSRQYTAGVVTGALAVVFGVLAPACTRLLLDAPKAFIMALAGLAMLRVLQAAFVASFSSRHTLGALVCIVVTIADQSLFNIGAAFWGLVAGFSVSWMMERADFAADRGR